MTIAAIVASALLALIHPFNLQDWTALRSASARAVDKSGTLILYVVSHGVPKGPTAQEWWTIHSDGSHPLKLALPKEFMPSGFTADGALFGTYAAKGKDPQIAVLEKGSTAPRVLTHLPHGAGPVWISPDGRRLATIASSAPVDPLADVRTVVQNEISTPFVVNIDGTDGRWWCPNLQDVQDLAWAPQSDRIALLSQTQKIGHHEVNSFIDVCAASGSRHVTTFPNAAASIAWLDGGTTIAFSGTSTPTLTPEHIFTVPAAGGDAVDRTPDLAGTASGLNADSRGNVWVLVTRGVQPEIDRYAAGALTVAYRVADGSIFDLPAFSPLAGSSAQIALSIGDPAHESNIAVPDGDTIRRITFEGDALLKGVSLGEMRVVHWQGPQTPLTGIVTFPPGYVAGKHYPFVSLPHGGPEGNDVLAFDPFSRLIAERGYVVLQPEYRGSTGVNSAFTAAIYQHFGDRAYADVDSGTDYAIAQGWADPNRLAMFGWSAGGFMTAWTITQTHRYRAAIEGAGITDWLSFIPASDIAQTDYDARSHIEDPQAFLKFSAVMYADKVTTPLLILHGEADRRVPTFQGREYFIFLRELGKTVRMVTYPGSPHFPRLWEQRRNVFVEVFEWLARYNGPGIPPSSAAMRARSEGCVENMNSNHAGCSSSARF